jgi:hypothetical protein
MRGNGRNAGTAYDRIVSAPGDAGTGGEVTCALDGAGSGEGAGAGGCVEVHAAARTMIASGRRLISTRSERRT